MHNFRWFFNIFWFLQSAERRRELMADLKSSYSTQRAIADARRDPLLERDLASTPPPGARARRNAD